MAQHGSSPVSNSARVEYCLGPSSAVQSKVPYNPIVHATCYPMAREEFSSSTMMNEEVGANRRLRQAESGPRQERAEVARS